MYSGIYLFVPSRVQWIFALKPEKTLTENELHVWATKNCFILSLYGSVSKGGLWGFEGSR